MTSALRKTSLHAIHTQLGGQMVSYAGFSMPVLYRSQSHVDSHRWVRRHAGLFDVSHMVQHRFKGRGAAQFLEQITPSDLRGLRPFSSTLSVFLNDNGGIVDDTMITRLADDEFYVVTNAGCRDKDLEFLATESEKYAGFGSFQHDTIDRGALIALQGPQAAKVLQALAPDTDLATIKFGETQMVRLVSATTPVQVSRGGYTGEDGFEISIVHEPSALSVVTSLLEQAEVRPVGLAARDSLRLEAGLCLYGHELDEQTTPVEAALSWVVHRTRREPGAAAFNGKSRVLQQIRDKPARLARLRAGLVIEGAPARHGVPIFSRDVSYDARANPIGSITSGSPSPTLDQNIAMGYVPLSQAVPGTKVNVLVRGTMRPAVVTRLPFVPTKYYK